MPNAIWNNNNNNANNPCFGCKDRFIRTNGNGKLERCHSTCKRYAEFQDKNKEIREKIKRETDIKVAVIDSANRRLCKLGLSKYNGFSK